MSAETLRRAAELMRERAKWCRLDTNSQTWKATVYDDGRAWIQPAHIAMHGYGYTADHIASWHPAVALAVADWLDHLAQDEDHVIRFMHGHALTVARAYLGESA